jgi:CheY-like chemotaxis protein
MTAIPLTPSEWVVLVVDDEQDNLNVVEMVMKLWGASIQTAKGGQAGIDQVVSNAYTFVLLDISMPLVDGWTVLKYIRSQQALKTLPVIALTAHAMLGDRELGLQAGFDGYITKPFNFKTLREDVIKTLTHLNQTRKATED